jgi:PAS domain S-box-containing protein
MPIVEKALTITMQGGWTGELIGKKKDGTRFPVSVSSSRVLDDQGNIIAHMANHRDITEQKQAVEALHVSEEKWHTLVNASRDAIYMNTRDGEFIDFNQSFLDLLGYTEKEMRTINAIDLYIDPNDRVTFLHEVDEKGSAKSYEVKLKTKDGAEIYVLNSATVRKAHDGSILGYQGIIRDITRRKQTEEALRESEEKWRSLAGTSPCIILTVQRDGTIQFLNACLSDWLSH